MNKMMKLPSLLLTSAMALASTGLMASEMTVSIDGFADPTTFMITASGNLSLRVSELVPAAGTNASTHMLIEGLAPLEDGTSVYASTYSGINVDSGEVQDIGIVYLDMPAGSGIPEGTVVSPIVGVVQRTGSWSGFSLTFPNTSLGGSSGSSSYQAGTIAITLIRDSEVFTGSAAYAVVDEDTLALEPFTLVKDAVTSYNLSGTTLMRSGDRFYGTLTNLSDGAAYDSLLFSIEFTGIPDLDGDGIPDISDGEVVAGLLTGQWNLTEIGWVYGYTPEWGYSLFMGFVYMGDMPWIYQIPYGWTYMQTSFPLTPSGLGFYMYIPADGWIYTQDNYGGFFWVIGTNPAVWKNFLNP